jgi:NAD(P)H dehydrogenase (quinone)
MHFLVVSATPRADSFNAALREAAVTALAAAGHEVEMLDLYAEGFAPALTAAERGRYFDTAANREGVEAEAAQLLRAEGLVLVYPTWWFGFPAILKGWFDRIWLPGLAFDLGGPGLQRKLHNIRRVAVVTSYGSPWWFIRFWVGDPMGKIIRRGIAALCHPSCRTLFLALYHMDATTEARRRRFLEEVRRRLATF